MSEILRAGRAYGNPKIRSTTIFKICKHDSTRYVCDSSSKLINCSTMCYLSSTLSPTFYTLRASLMEGITQSCIKKIPKSNSYEGGTRILGGSNCRLFFIPRVKSPRFDPRYKIIDPGGQYCIILPQWIMFSSLRDF
jgi:hypothetical protein